MFRLSVPLVLALFGLIENVARGVLRQIGALSQALANRRAVRHLAEFDDRMLKDIGLSRSEVEGALLSALLQDPSIQLARHPSDGTCATPRAANGRPVVPLKAVEGCA